MQGLVRIPIQHPPELVRSIDLPNCLYNLPDGHGQ